MDLQQEETKEIKNKRIYGGVNIGSWPAPLDSPIAEDILLPEIDQIYERNLEDRVSPYSMPKKVSSSWESHDKPINYESEDCPSTT